jgi:hypothetical protein
MICFGLAVRASLLATVWMLLAGDIDARAASCKRDGTRTLASIGEIRVFERGAREAVRVYACSRRTGRAMFLGEDSSPHGGKPEGFRVHGRYLAYTESTVASDGDVDLSVSVVNARSRKRTASWHFQNFFQEEALRVRGARLKADGSFAFLVGATDGPFVGNPPLPGGPEYSVHMFDDRGTRILDAAGDIDPRSFRASDTSVSWRRAGEPRQSDFH